MLFQTMTANELPSQNERQTMHLLFSPVLASALIIGGGGLGLLLIIVVVVLLLR
jgi:cellobiose-specific phosphotransferase system component IIC